MKAEEAKKILDEHGGEIGGTHNNVLKMIVDGKGPTEIGKEINMPITKVTNLLSRLKKKYIKKERKNSPVRIIVPEKQVSISKKDKKYILLITDDKNLVEEILGEYL